MTITTVPITGITLGVEVYGGLPAATEYVATLLGKPADKWSKLSANNKAKTLVMASRYLDQQAWLGVATGTAGATVTTLAWPRHDDDDVLILTLADGTEVDGTVVPIEIVQATCDLAVLIAANPAIVTKPDTGSNVQSAQAGGGTGVTFFAPTSVAAGTATPMPAILMRIVGKFLAGGTELGGGYVGCFGASGKRSSDFASCHELDRTDPF